ncbi:class I SAM-dependent DNA methyltransferase [Roseivivax sediminis]|uniref:Methyltransferase domain-containing protein n=1 Tax=Roseivivax sediminis TaxID=936889 RepID=A0A1I2E8Z9_9RHOB|nr:methyltransferase domain-containing protein [Roseivivax sediminis]SFE88968.1 Methyltransferase domain-containing protein [Roseivivax sediminis]
MAEKKVNEVYDLKGDDVQRAYYDDWARSYDQELVDLDYRTPGRCAAALSATGLAKDAPILDFACGTGLSGKALADAGYTVIDGTDISEGMLDEARKLGVYRDLHVGVVGHEPDIPPDTYQAISAVGAISPGAAPATYLTTCLHALPKGGHMVVSFNEHIEDDPTYQQTLDKVIETGMAELISSEYGDHLPGRGTKSWVHVLRRL